MVSLNSRANSSDQEAAKFAFSKADDTTHTRAFTRRTFSLELAGAISAAAQLWHHTKTPILSMDNCSSKDSEVVSLTFRDVSLPNGSLGPLSTLLDYACFVGDECVLVPQRVVDNQRLPASLKVEECPPLKLQSCDKLIALPEGDSYARSRPRLCCSSPRK